MQQIKSITVSLITAAVLVLSAAAPVFSQYSIETETEISWITGDILISATAEIPVSDANITSARFRITETIDRGLTSIVTGAFDDIYLDSMQTLSEGFTSSRKRLSAFDELNLTKNRVSSSMSLNLDSVTNLYKYNIYNDLIPLFIGHRKTAPIPKVLNYESTATFSGIIIYAAEPLPCYGESATAELEPAVFPAIYTTEMAPVASAVMAEPEYLERWGFVLYTDSLDERRIEQRIGLYPYRTTAEAIFGNNRTDILIPAEAARKILYNKENHRLIREGRIVVIVGSPD